MHLPAVQHKCFLSQSGKAGNSLISQVLIECSCRDTRLLLMAYPGTICFPFVRYRLYLKSTEALSLFPLAPFVAIVFSESTRHQGWTDFALNPFRDNVDILGGNNISCFLMYHSPQKQPRVLYLGLIDIKISATQSKTATVTTVFNS